MTGAIDPQSAWRGPFSSWDAALAHVDGEKGAWSDKGWMRRQQRFLYDAGSESTLPPRPTSLPTVAGALDARRIVDYGGGSGWAFELLRKSCPTLKLTSYTVLELSEVVRALQQFPAVDPRLTYAPFDDFHALRSTDLLYSNASLHYAKSERPFHATAIELGPAPWLLLDGYIAHPKREFFLLQRVYGREVPVRVPHLDRSLQDLRDLGYRVTSCTPMLGPVSGEYSYRLPLQPLGPEYLDTIRFCMTAKWSGIP